MESNQVEMELEVMKDYQKESEKIFKDYGITVKDVVVKDWGFVVIIKIKKMWVQSFRNWIKAQKVRNISQRIPGLVDNQ